MAGSDREKPSPGAMFVEAHEEFVQQMEAGQRRIKFLSAAFLVVSLVLSLSYISQILLPFATGESTVTVNLLDPALLAFELVLFFFLLGGVYIGGKYFIFARRMGRSLKEARAAEKEMAAQAGLS